MACTFRLDSVSASMDTIPFAVQKSVGQVEMIPRKGKITEPEVNVSFDSGLLIASAGAGTGTMNNMKLKAFKLVFVWLLLRLSLNFQNKGSKIFNWLIVCIIGSLIRKEPYSCFFNFITIPT